MVISSKTNSQHKAAVMSSPTRKFLLQDLKILKKRSTLKSFGVHFAPKDPCQTTFGRESIIVYPKINSEMPMSEKSHDFNVGRAAINSSSLSVTSKVQLMGSLHNAKTIININRMEWEENAFDAAKNNTCMTLLSFHNSTGKSMDNCIDPVTGFLKTIQDGNVADCRPNDV